MIMQRASSVSICVSSHSTVTPAARKNSQREHRAFFMFRRTAKHGPQLVRLHLPKCGLAQSFEYFWNGQPRGLLNPSIEVHEPPRKLSRQ